MQVPFFALFGVTWFALCLHAAVINGLFCIAVYTFLRLCLATIWEAAAFGALSAFFFYPPTGTPFTDQHSFFFTMLMFVAVAVGSRDPVSWRARLAWFVVPTLFILGLLSCQIPTAFAALCVAVWVFANPRRAPEWMAALAAGTLAIGVALVLVALVAGWICDPPSRTSLPRRCSRAARERRCPGSCRRCAWWPAPCDVCRAGAPLVSVSRHRRHPARSVHGEAKYRLAASPLGVSRVDYFNRRLRRLLEDADRGGTGVRHGDRRYGCDRDSTRAHEQAVAGRRAGRDGDCRRTRHGALHPAGRRAGTVHKEFDPRAADAAEGHLPAGLSFMRWSRGASHYEPEELSALVRYLRDADGDFLLIGDSTVLYGLAGKVSPMRTLWLDPGLTLPRADSREFAAFEADLVARVRDFGVRRIVLEGPRTWSGVSLNDFPTLKQLAASRGCGEKTFGAVRVLEMCSDL
jgi:hypothetical protein